MPGVVRTARNRPTVSCTATVVERSAANEARSATVWQYVNHHVSKAHVSVVQSSIANKPKVMHTTVPMTRVRILAEQEANHLSQAGIKLCGRLPYPNDTA